MVEFKRDIRDGVAKLMEINGRLWGSLQLSVSSGVDFPDLCLDYYLDRKAFSHISDYRVGHRLKWVLGIIDHLIARLKPGGHILNLPPGFPSRWQVARELMKIGDANTSFDVFNWEDLKPFIMENIWFIENLARLKR